MITPTELLEWAIRNVDPRDEAAMLGASTQLRALWANRDFVIEGLKEELEAIGTGAMSKMTSSQAFHFGTLRRGDVSFAIRCALWTPLTAKNRASQDLQDKVYSFLTPHDHNFSLLTIGYLGPGYTTDIFEYDRSRVKGYIGEKVALDFHKRVQLSEGEIINFRPLRDVHTQFHPPGVSLSLNLIGEHPDLVTKAQFEFDTTSRRITGLLNGNSVQKQIIAFKLLAELDVGDDFVELLDHIARRHYSEHIRSESLRTLMRISSSDADRWRSISAADPHPYVRDLCII